jgi:hypothetical protein
MKDDGRNGDAKSGDRVFSFQVTVNEPDVKTLFWRVSAPFKGSLQRVLSPVVAVTVDPVSLPPDPGDAGKQTIEGIDSDSDGLRDDIQRHIAIRYEQQSSLQPGLTQLARSYQQFLLNSDAPDDDVYTIAEARGRAQDCLTYLAGSPTASLALLRDLRSQLLNTRARSLAYAEADKKLSGKFFASTDSNQYSSQCE